jgi:uncharacterized protein YprB with RNaseH-like and TPR domain
MATALDTLPKILIWDLETTHLKGNMGHILCAAYKWAGSDDIWSWRIDQEKGFGTTPKSYVNDKPIVQDLVDRLTEADAHVAHYGERFDARFLRTRCLMWGIPPFPPVKIVDTWKYARNYLALTSNRLETLANVLGTQNKKYKLPLEVWQLAQHGDRKILKMMEEYCRNDVLTLEDVYNKMRPVIYDHPHCGAGKGKCPACGSNKVYKNGTRRSRVFLYQRWLCMGCGSSFTGEQKKI